MASDGDSVMDNVRVHEEICDSNSNVCKSGDDTSGSSDKLHTEQLDTNGISDPEVSHAAPLATEDDDSSQDDTFESVASDEKEKSRTSSPCEVSDEGLGSSQGQYEDSEDSSHTVDAAEKDTPKDENVKEDSEDNDTESSTQPIVAGSKDTDESVPVPSESEDIVAVSSQSIEVTEVISVQPSKCSEVIETELEHSLSSSNAVAESVTATDFPLVVTEPSTKPSNDNKDITESVDSESCIILDPVEVVEVEYTGTINVDNSCLESLDLVQSSDIKDIQNDDVPDIKGYEDGKAPIESSPISKEEDRLSQSKDDTPTGSRDSDDLQSKHDLPEMDEEHNVVNTEVVINGSDKQKCDDSTGKEKHIESEEHNVVNTEVVISDSDKQKCDDSTGKEKRIESENIQADSTSDFSHSTDDTEKCHKATVGVPSSAKDNNKPVVNPAIISSSSQPNSDNARESTELEVVVEKNKDVKKPVELEDSDVSWHTCLRCFREKMATLGVQSSSLETFITSSTITLQTLCTRHRNVRLKRQNTDPGVVDHSLVDNRAIKIVKMASFDASDIHENGVDSGDGMDTMIIHEINTDTEKRDSSPSLDEIKEKREANSTRNVTSEATVEATQASPADINTLAMLRDLGKKLYHEHEQRKRAEDWAEFLTLELDAQIDARSTADDRRVDLRDRMIRLAGKYRKLKMDHAALVTQINDIALEDKPPSERAVQRPKSSILRRNRSQGDRGALLVKRNAMLIKGSTRQNSSTDSDSATEATHEKQNARGTAPRNVDDVKQRWEVNQQNKQKEEQERKNATSSTDMSISSLNDNSVDMSELLSQTNDQDKFKTEMAAYEKYVTSTPIKSAESVGELNVPLIKLSAATNKCKSTPDIRIEKTENVHEEDGGVQVNVRAFTNMWEQKIQKIPFEIKVSTQHVNTEKAISPSSTPKRNHNKKIADFQKKVDDTVKGHKLPERRERKDIPLSTDSSDDEFFDVDDLTPDGSHCDDILTTSLNTKHTLNMWENLAAVNSSEGSKSANHSSLSRSGSVNERSLSRSGSARLSNLSRSSSNVSPRAMVEVQVTSHEDGDLVLNNELPLERSNRFSSLKTQWEKKGRANVSK